MRFEANRGQAPNGIRFLARGSGYSLLLKQEGAVLSLRKDAGRPADESGGASPGGGAAQAACQIRFGLAGANRTPRVVGVGELTGRSNYLIGAEPRAWRTGVENYGKVKYEEVYDRIDLVYYGNEGQLEYDFILAPGADPARIAMGFEGARRAEITEEGDLLLSACGGEVRLRKPFAYQEVGGRRREVPAGYVEGRRGVIRFRVGEYDRRLPLVIDPVLIYSSYLGGGLTDQGTSVKLGADGSAYVAGNTLSTDFPVAGAIQSSKGASQDAFILKLSPDGKSLIYATYLGGDGDDYAAGLAVDAAGNAYVAGTTLSSNFPHTAGALQGAKDVLADAYVAKLNPSGSALVYSTFVGGNLYDSGLGVALDASGNAYLTGRTESTAFQSFAASGSKSGAPASKSVDAAAGWTNIGTSGLTSPVVHVIALDPSDSNTLYAGTNNGLFKSTDGGANWNVTGASSPSAFPSVTYAVAVDPSNANVVYAGALNGLYKSTDGGASFVRKDSNFFVNAHALLIDPAATSTVYVATFNGVMKSTNGGDTWTNVSTGIPSFTPVYELAFDPTNSSTVYAATARGMYKTTNGGAGWAAINNGLIPFANNPAPAVGAVAVSKSSPQTLYAGVQGPKPGVYKSTDGGANWTQKNSGLTYQGPGAAWTPTVNTVAVDPADASVVYAGTSPAGVYMSTDGAENWAQSNVGLGSRSVLSLALDGRAPTHLFAGANAGGDAFVAKLNAAGSALGYFLYLGGSENEEARGVATDAAGSAYVVGTTDSFNFPVAGAFQSSAGGIQDAFVTKVNATGTALVYSTYLGGDGGDRGRGIAIDAQGAAYLTGDTYSTNFPTANALQPSLAEFTDAFVTKLSADGSSLAYSTYLGGDNLDSGLAVAVDAQGHAYVTGSTSSMTFPLFDNFTESGLFDDVFLTKFNPAGTALIYSTIFGGTGTDVGNALAVSAAGNVYVVGNTSSSNFPVARSLRSTRAGGTDAFIAKFGTEADLSVVMSDSRDPVMVGNQFTYTLRVNNAGPSTATAVTLTDTLPAALTLVSATPSQGTCGASGQVVTCNLGTLPPSSGATVVLTLNPTAAGVVTNTAAVSAPEPDDNPSNNAATETTKISNSPTVSGRVTAPGGAGLAGVTLTLSGAQSATTQTDAAGFYQFTEIPAGGSYVVTPSKENVSFEPPSRTFDNLGADQTADFTGTNCSWTLSPPVADIGAGGGGGSVTVNTLRGCPWTATSGSDWITITSGASGADTGTVSFNVTAASAPRVGRLNIAGQSFPVYQEFGSCGAPDFAVLRYTLPFTSSPVLMRSADLNGDGSADLVLSTRNTGGGLTGTVMLNDGSGHFTSAPFDLDVGAPQTIALGDFNGDGRPDIAVTSYNSNNVHVLFNDGAGHFGRIVNVAFSSQGQSPLTRDVWSADLNRDGKADLIVSTPGANGLQILLGNGAGGFTQAAPVNNSSPADSLVALADVNADGAPDLLYGYGGFGSPNLSVRLGDGTGAFGSPIVAGTKAASVMGAADFNGDGRLDLAVPTSIPDPSSTPSNPRTINGIAILAGNGAGHFTRKSFTETIPMNDMVVADFNADAKPDVAYSTRAATFVVRLGDGAGGLGAELVTQTGVSTTYAGLYGIVAADFDGDSRPELAGAAYSDGAVVLKNNCAAAPYIWGRVTDTGNTIGVRGVTVSVSGAQASSAITDEGGNYFIGGLAAGGSYVITPSKENYRFSPASATINGLAGGQAVNFGATPMLVRLAKNHYVVDENLNSSLQIDVVRSGDKSGPAAVNYSTGPGTYNTASERSDYTYAAGTLNFAPNETTKSFTVLLNDDNLLEGWESLTVKLTGATGAILSSPATALVEIRDNETSQAASNPIDSSAFFVRQHYHDFLNREPDASGLNFWTNEIEKCGAVAQCREVKRINVSAAFFLSIEFQQTGYLVYRTYKAAFGDAASPNVPGTVPVIRLDEFLPDAQRIGKGVQVNVGDWQSQLEANKQAYMLDFVRRPRFNDAFPASMTPALFVDRLNQNAGGVLSQSEREQLVAELSAATDAMQGRASVLMKVAEDTDLHDGEKSRAFVLMQYYGYLRRNPDDPQDADFRGWKFWLDKLNEFNGNFVRAEMVKAFLESIEYRKRFGQ